MTKNILFIQPTITHRAGIDMALDPIIRLLSKDNSIQSHISQNKYKVYTLSAYENYNKENKSNILDIDNGAINMSMGENINDVYQHNKFFNLLYKFYKMINRSYQIFKCAKENNINIIITSGDGLIISSLISKLITNNFWKVNRSKVDRRYYSFIHENMNNINKINQYILKRILKYSDKVVAVSYGLADSLIKYVNIENILVIENSIDINNRQIENIMNMDSEAIYNYKYKKSSKYNFLAIGRLENVKDYDMMIKSFVKAKNTIEQNTDLSQRLSIHLNIIGEGRERYNLEKLIIELKADKYIKLLGSKSKEEVYKSLISSYTYINTSKMETFGLSILEALSSGMPVIINNCDYGPREICQIPSYIIDKLNTYNNYVFDYGIICNKGDIDGLATAIIKICDKKVYNNLQIDRAIDRAKYYSAQNIIKKWLDIL